MEDAQLTEGQKSALNLLRGDENVFLTGAAGTGKSYTIRSFLSEVSSKNFPILASTGAAAVLVGGRTFHSFMGLGIMEGGPQETISRALKDRRLIKRLQKIDGFILDEVSMISGPVLQTAEQICRRVREQPLLPWGGLRVIAVGDFAQLPPVTVSSAQRLWAFEAPVWKSSFFRSVFLTESIRAQDLQLLDLLNEMRLGEMSQQSATKLNERTIEDFQDENITFLYPRRYQVDRMNQLKLQNVKGPETCFQSEYSGQDRWVQSLKKFSPLPEELVLKEGALVMLRQNDPRRRWVNGSTGIVAKISDGAIEVDLLSGRRVSVEKSTFSLQNAEGVVLAAVTNFPLTLAYAMTIHKAQGATLDRMRVDLQSLWEPGQAYVAVSRVRNLSDLYIESWDRRSIKSDPRVISFYKAILADQNNFSSETVQDSYEVSPF